MAAALDRQVLKAAATWYVQLSAAPPSEQERQAWRAWLAENAAHTQAWARVEKLQRQLGALPQDVALPTLAGARAKRRAVVKVLGVLLAAGATGWGALALEPLPARLAQYRTAKGQRRHVALADGSQVDLDTHSAVDVDYSAHLRQVHLHHGQILIQTAADPAGRPFVVHTRHGSVRALGTRFCVRSEAGHTQVQVLEHAVELRPRHAPHQVLRLDAGQQGSFDLAPPSALPAGSDAWARGMLMAVDWRLGELLSEIARYRPGVLQCSDAVAGLRLSGAFRLDDSDTLLENLATSLPVRVRFLTRYWVRVEPA